MLRNFIEWCTPKVDDVDLIPLALAVSALAFLLAIVEIIRYRRGRTPQDSPLARTLKNLIATEREPELPWTWKDYSKLTALSEQSRHICIALIGEHRRSVAT
jgi:hypothetical protein